MENTLPLYKWKYDDIDIWPLVKKVVFFKWNSENDVSLREASYKTAPKLQKQESFTTIKDIIYKFNNDTKLTKKNILFSGAKGHRIEYGEKFINRYYEPLKENNHFLFVEYGEIDKSKNYPENITEIERYLPYYYLKYRIQNKKKYLFTPGISDFNVLLKKNNLENLTLSENSVLGYSYPVYLYSQAYAEIINKIKPEIIYGLCYYSPAMLGLFHAANKLGVENYDIQHGAQGNLHPMYTYSNFPKKGLNTLPQKFWLWNNDSYNHIKQWLPKEGYHKAAMRGNPWLNFAMNDSNNKILMDEKMILYTMQYPVLDDYILETIQKTSDEYKWWLRLHPRMKDMVGIYKQLKQFNIEDKVEIKKATELPLPVLLNACSIHVSKYSGSIIEAELLNKHSIILEKVGCDTYKEIINRGNATGLLNPSSDDIIKYILTLT